MKSKEDRPPSRNLTVAISGASSPLGLSLSVGLIRSGYEVVGLTRRVTAALKDLEGKSTLFKVEKADLARRADILRVIGRVRRRYGRLDTLINNACGWSPGGLLQTDLAEIRDQVNSSISGTVELTKLALPLLSAGSNPLIVNICSTVGSGRRFSANTLYVTLKGALDGFGRALRNDLRGSGVRVTNLYLGRFEDGEVQGNSLVPLHDIARAINFLIAVSPRTSVDTVCLTPLALEY
jgi:NAD(P)-dependent dehydrogenase (short-subunit alcohol dehydrogenase family)